MEVPKAVIVEYERNDVIRKLLEDFRDMVNFAIEQGLKHGYSLRRLHELCYNVFSRKYDYYALYYPMAYRIAQSILRSWKNRGKKPQMVKRIVRVHKQLFRLDIENSKLFLKVRKGEEVEVPLKLSDYHKEELRKGRIGEILINDKNIYIPVTIEIKLGAY